MCCRRRLWRGPACAGALRPCAVAATSVPVPVRGIPRHLRRTLLSHALIVDDDTDSAQMMAALIAAEHFTVATAHNLRDARRQMALQQPDIVLLDLQLPDGSGMDLFDDPELVAHSEVVLITGHA